MKERIDYRQRNLVRSPRADKKLNKFSPRKDNLTELKELFLSFRSTTVKEDFRKGFKY